MNRFKITLHDKTGFDIGVIDAEFIVVAESAAEAESYVRDFVTVCNHGCCYEMITREIPTTLS